MSKGWKQKEIILQSKYNENIRNLEFFEPEMVQPAPVYGIEPNNVLFDTFENFGEDKNMKDNEEIMLNDLLKLIKRLKNDTNNFLLYRRAGFSQYMYRSYSIMYSLNSPTDP